MSDNINEYPVIDALCGIDAASPQISQYTDNFGKIKFMLGKNLDGYILMIITDINGHVEIVRTDGETLIQETDAETGETSLLWNIGSEVTASHGVVVYQIVGYKSEDDVVVSTWYSKEGRLLVTESIDTTSYSTDIVGANPNLITQLIVECGQTRQACEQKVDKIEGKGLSACDFTLDEKEKLSTVNAEAQKNVQSDWFEDDESSDSYIKNKPVVDRELDIGSDNAIANWIVASQFDAMGEAFRYTEGEVEKVKDGLGEVNILAGNLQTEADKHRNNEDVDIKHLTEEEMKKVYASYESLTAIVNGDVSVPNADIANVALMDAEMDDITAKYVRISDLYSLPITNPDVTIEPNKAYNFGYINEFTLSLPTQASDGDVIYIGFVCLDEMNFVVDMTNIFEFDLVPEINTGYEIYAKFNGYLHKWIVKYSEYTGVSE